MKTLAVTVHELNWFNSSELKQQKTNSSFIQNSQFSTLHTGGLILNAEKKGALIHNHKLKIIKLILMQQKYTPLRKPGISRAA